MAELKDEAEVNQSTEQQSHSFVEVICKCTGKTWRFAAGTEAKFALKFINRSSVDSILANQPATYVEAVKDGEVPVIFGPNSILVNYGKGWKLQPVTETTSFSSGMPDDHAEVRPAYIPPVSDNSHSARSNSQAPLSPIYIGKILLVFVLMFLIGALFTLLLDNLPQLLSRYGLDVE
ncbi:uncharacterized protein LOC129877463 isoform X2 [Solanum dulcamara]|uniref:uncharacterized protein LOC129877463 isoform X2 n=1 Tax=Solanum dulcamara TaxID=45834 RepID=UPI0024854924|nr:uncharacterized protein LOC129877463 isoform X2 [Solanum dulcamara]